ncbi:MAG: PAS domain S-box protein [Halopseudomonas aestusnigri]
MEHLGQEVFFDRDKLIVSKTDLKGRITYANDTFLKIAGYSEEEIMGKPHNIIRNPNMPRAVFEVLWQVLSQEKEIFAFVVNSTKKSDYYWVLAHVTPSFVNGKIVGYHSTRRVPNSETIKQIIEPLYVELKEIEDRNQNKKKGTKDAIDALYSILREKQLSYVNFMAQLMDFN